MSVVLNVLHNFHASHLIKQVINKYEVNFEHEGPVIPLKHAARAK